MASDMPARTRPAAHPSVRWHSMVSWDCVNPSTPAARSPAASPTSKRRSAARISVTIPANRIRARPSAGSTRVASTIRSSGGAMVIR